MELLKNLRILTIGIVIALGAIYLTLLFTDSVTTVQDGSAGGISFLSKRSIRDYADTTKLYFDGSFVVQNDYFTKQLIDPQNIEHRLKAADYRIRLRRIYAETALAPYLQQIDITGFDGAASGGLRVQFRLTFFDPTYKFTDAPMKILFLQAVDHAAWKIGSPLYNLKIASDSININGDNLASLLPFQSTHAQVQAGDTASPSALPSASTTIRVTIAPNPQCSRDKIRYCEGMPYDYVRYPNRFGHRNGVEAEAAVALFQVLENVQCHAAIRNFTCYLLQPPCNQTSGETEPLCRPFCESVMQNCTRFIKNTVYEKQIDCRDFKRTENATECTQACDANDFHCGESGFCVPATAKCDLNFDCGKNDKSDEMNCPCNRTDLFRCSNGVCIQERKHCDNFNDCGEWEDELPCRCSSGYRKCNRTGQCVPERAFCDYKFDCADRSDEANCTCKDTDYKCQGGYCKPANTRCNGVNDCGDFSDEFDCDCEAYEFRCDGYLCKSYIKHWCNRRPDCDDETDELKNCTCKEYQFKCDSGQCIPIMEQCDGKPQCDDNSDELHCNCTELEFACGDGSCVPKSVVCDGKPQCMNAADEKQNCTCKENEFPCNDGSCKSMNWWCDGSPDCRGGEDEADNCAATCPSEHPIRCSLVSSRQIACLHKNHICDGISDCAQSEDEIACKCDADKQFQCRNGMCKSWNAWCNGFKDCTDASDEPPNCACDQIHQRRCANGACFDKNGRCDKKPDCADFSDEQNCTCADYLRRFEPQKVCDHTIDCADFSDESQCDQCTPDSFVCHTKCIPPEQVCDGVKHCLDGEDEAHCLRLADGSTDHHLSYWLAIPEGYLYGRQGSYWYKVCADSFARLAPNDLQTIGARICYDFLHYKSLMDIQIIKDYEFGMYLHLAEYQNLEQLRFAPSLCLSQQVLHLKCSNMTCGVRPLHQAPKARIVGGTDARPGRWPWYAAVLKNGDQWCGSTIISDRWVVSAAHCFSTTSLLSNEPPRHAVVSMSNNLFAYDAANIQLTVRAGTFRNSSNSPFDQFRQVTHIVRHSMYDADAGWNDIALLRLQDPLDFGAYVMPACLPGKKDPVPKNQTCYIVGMGSLGWKISQAETLQELVVPVMDSAECRKIPSINMDFKIRGTQLCAGVLTGGKDACQGDSGGPLFCADDKGFFTLVGIVSRGYSCAKPGTPGLYTKVSEYVEWIEGMIRTPPGDSADPFCSSTQLQCLDGRCYNATSQCDGRWDCRFGEDEIACDYLRLISTSSTLTFPPPLRTTRRPLPPLTSSFPTLPPPLTFPSPEPNTVAPFTFPRPATTPTPFGPLPFTIETFEPLQPFRPTITGFPLPTQLPLGPLIVGNVTLSFGPPFPFTDRSSQDIDLTAQLGTFKPTINQLFNPIRPNGPALQPNPGHQLKPPPSSSVAAGFPDYGPARLMPTGIVDSFSAQRMPAAGPILYGSSSRGSMQPVQQAAAPLFSFPSNGNSRTANNVKFPRFP